jgi:hypothetical protein
LKRLRRSGRATATSRAITTPLRYAPAALSMHGRIQTGVGMS